MVLISIFLEKTHHFFYFSNQILMNSSVSQNLYKKVQWTWNLDTLFVSSNVDAVKKKKKNDDSLNMASYVIFPYFRIISQILRLI